MAEIVNRSLSEENSILWPVSVEMTVEDKNVSIVKVCGIANQVNKEKKRVNI